LILSIIALYFRNNRDFIHAVFFSSSKIGNARNNILYNTLKRIVIKFTSENCIGRPIRHFDGETSEPDKRPRLFNYHRKHVAQSVAGHSPRGKNDNYLHTRVSDRLRMEEANYSVWIELRWERATQRAGTHGDIYTVRRAGESGLVRGRIRECVTRDSTRFSNLRRSIRCAWPEAKSHIAHKVASFHYWGKFDVAYCWIFAILIKGSVNLMERQK